jgi:mono/diheme cytochrome c family protein
MRIHLHRIVAIAAALLAASAARAQDIASGKHIAKTWCSSCHEIGSDERKSVSDAVPSFSSIAQMKSTTATSLAAFLSTPHANMPNFVLTRTEIRDVSAYILSLRKLR